MLIVCCFLLWVLVVLCVIRSEIHRRDLVIFDKCEVCEMINWRVVMVMAMVASLALAIHNMSARSFGRRREDLSEAIEIVFGENY